MKLGFWGSGSLQARLQWIAVLGVAACVIVGVFVASLYRTGLMDEKRAATRAVVDSAYGVLAHYEALEREGGMDRAQAQKAAIGVLKGMRYGKDDYFWINDMHPTVIMHPIKPALDGKDVSNVKDPTGKPLFVAFVDRVKQDGAGFVDYLWPKPGQAEPVEKVSYVRGMANWGWIVGSGVYVDDVDAQARSANLKIIALTAAVAAILVLVTLWIGRSITGPIRKALAVAEGIAQGDLTHKFDAKPRHEAEQLLVALSHTAAQLKGFIDEVKKSAQAIATASGEIRAGNDDLSQRTEEQASSLEQTASSMEELTSTVKQNADNARQANQLALGASTVAVKGGEVVGEVVNTMSSINESSKKIVDIISVIDGIAFQTNILALNAAVEAARAGEQGRGFAVVASEVRSLAQRSSTAAKEIKALIDDSVDKVGAGTKLVDEAGKTMEEIVSSVKRVTDIMSEITAASEEQSSGIEQVNQAITQMDKTTQQNAALVEEASTAAELMQEQEQHLAQALAVFRMASDMTALDADFDFEKATNAHVNWKHRLYAYINGAGESLEAAKVSSDKQCALGEWMYGAGKQFAQRAEYESLRSAHAGFHQCAGQVVNLTQTGRKDAARLLLGTQFEVESKKTIERLAVMRQVAGKRASKVARLPPKPKPKAQARHAVKAKTGTDGDWSRF
ncbi:MAG: cache domain-containing protein [Burkholderiales bacterium]|nr:cache domain-containing protein [Burkholderiales bacterium]